MSNQQEFGSSMPEVWGSFDYSNLIMLYSKIIYAGHDVYVTNAGIGDQKQLLDNFKKIQDNFILEKAVEGCSGACNIWKLNIKYPLLKKVVPPTE